MHITTPANLTTTTASTSSDAPKVLTHTWLLGANPTMQRAIKRWLFVAPCYVLALGLFGIACIQGSAPADAVLFLSAYSVLGLLGFYIALRSGWSAQKRDPMLTFPQVLFNASAIVLAYALTEISRSVALQLLFLNVVFDMQRLNSAQTQRVVYGALAMLLAMLGIMLAWQPNGFNLRNEIVNIAMATVMLPVLSTMSREVRRVRRMQQEQRNELQVTLDRLRNLSIRDPLTDLYNRRHMLCLLEDQVLRKRRVGHSFSMSIIDLDFFKRINDGFGHSVGDAVLREFARIANAVMRGTDAVGRWGGEEFIVLMPDTNIEQARLALERLREAVAEQDWAALAPGLKVTFSAGVCEHASDATLTQTLEWADRALYMAKVAGRNCVSTRANA